MDGTTLTLIQTLVTVLVSVIASSGFWTYIISRKDRKNLQEKLLIGLAHNELVQQGLIYIMRGWITQDEYENLTVYLYKPYVDLGGNGSVTRLMNDVDKLPIRKEKFFDKITGDTLP